VLGAIAGDIIGSVHEHVGTKTKEFPLFTPLTRFTDDTVLTVAVADAVLNGRDYVDSFHEYVSEYPDAGYGAAFMQWARRRNRVPYNSFGNGSAMRVSSVAHLFHTLDEVLAEAERSAAVTHSHPEGIKGAKAVAATVFLARTGADKPGIKSFVEETFGYDLSRDLDSIRPTYAFDVTCQGTVPEAIISFLASTDFEDAIRNAMSLGGDADTLACITGRLPSRSTGAFQPRSSPECFPFWMIASTASFAHFKNVSETLARPARNNVLGRVLCPRRGANLRA
jgi:ADP-ribosylglycohydrolase